MLLINFDNLLSVVYAIGKKVLRRFFKTNVVPTSKNLDNNVQCVWGPEAGS